MYDWATVRDELLRNSMSTLNDVQQSVHMRMASEQMDIESNSDMNTVEETKQ